MFIGRVFGVSVPYIVCQHCNIYILGYFVSTDFLG